MPPHQQDRKTGNIFPDNLVRGSSKQCSCSRDDKVDGMGYCIDYDNTGGQVIQEYSLE